MAEDVVMVIEGEDGRNWLTGPPLAVMPRAGDLFSIDGEKPLRVTVVEHFVRLGQTRKHIVTVKVRPV